MSQNPQQTPPAGPPSTAGGLAKDLGRELGDGLVEIGMWVLAVLVLVVLPGWIGSLVGGGVGLLVGAGLGAVALGVLWLVLLVRGAKLAAALWRRTPPA